MNNFSQWARIAMLVAAGALGAGACTSAEDESEPPAVGFAEHMHGHLDEVNQIKAAVIAGDLEMARPPAVWLSEHSEPPGMPDDWSPYLWEMRQYASTIASARDLRPAAVAVSEIGRTCGECHRDHAVEIEFIAGPRPPMEPHDIRTEMARHLWAADRLWESLLGSSDVAWAEGMAILEEVRLVPTELDDAPERAAQVEALVQRIRTLGEEGGRAPAGPARSALYGEFLATCASCHTLTGGGPGRVAMHVGGITTAAR